MKLTNKPNQKRIWVALAALIGILAVAGGSFAAYTSQAYQRGVVRNRDNEAVRFTSNYLQNCALSTDEKSYVGRTILFNDDDKKNDNLTFDIYVYNYVNGNTDLVSQRDITYDMTISFKDGAGNGYSVLDADGNTTESPDTDGKVEFKGKTLVGRNAAYHIYTVTFPGSDLNTLKITAVAKPTNSSVTNNQMLAAVIAPSIDSTTKKFNFQKGFLEENKGIPEEGLSAYDGFNYEVSISSGKATATLTWDPSILEIDPFFLKSIGKDTKEIKEILQNTTTGTVTFEMNQPEGTGAYLIPFYIKDKSKIKDIKDWKELEVDFVANEIQ